MQKETANSSEGSSHSDLPGQGKILAAIATETDLTGHTMSFPMKMLRCYRMLAEMTMKNGDASDTLTVESIEALGALTEASLYELGGFDENDIYACKQ